MSQIIKIWNFLKGKKTYIVAAITILYALVALWGGQVDFNTAMEMILAALGLGAIGHKVDRMLK